MLEIEYGLSRAYKVAQLSNDRSTQNGAFVWDENPLKMGAWGFNHIPKAYDKEEYFDAPLKYLVTEHAERDAIYRATTLGINLHGATLYCPWAACADCARAIIYTGIGTLVRHKEAMDRIPSETWRESIEVADMMMEKSGVEIIEYDGEIVRPTLLYQGKPW